MCSRFSNALFSSLLLLTMAAHAASTGDARKLAASGHADDAIGQVQSVLSSNPNDARAHSLLCTIYGTLERFDDAIHECEAAASRNPNSSDYQLFLARAYGNKADHAGALTGMRLVGKIRGGFERAVQLDGKNVEALSDLGEFYCSAPGMVGGGTDKAKPLAQTLLSLNPARGHRLLAMIAARDGDQAKAESEYQAAISAGHTSEAYVDLAKYYVNKKSWDKAEAASRDAIAHDPQHGADVIDAAKILLKINRDLSVAAKACRDYLAGSSQIVDEPAFRVHTLLGQILSRQGDVGGAQNEFQSALALAHDYAPARKGAHS